MKKFVSSSLADFLSEAEEPVALAVLGAPAGGKSFTMSKIKDVVDDSGVLRAIEKGEKLSIDKLRDEFRSKDPYDQLKGFVRAFYLMREKYKKDPEEYGKWFKDIINMWENKFSKLIPDLNITASPKDLKFDGKPAYQSIKRLKDVDAEKVIGKLDNYNDYKRVVRYFQNIKQSEAKNKKIDISYDESGDEPRKIVKNLEDLHDDKYVTDVFLIHPENVASNIIQNFYRVTIGGDGGRDSSKAILGAYKDIEENKDIYTSHSEEDITVKSKNIQKVSDPLKKANVPDDPKKGDKPIDLFIEVQPMDPNEAYKVFMKKLDKNQKLVFNALLKYSVYDLPGMPQKAKDAILGLTNKLTNEQAIKVLRQAAKSGKYNFEYGGVSSELAKRAAEIIK
jgi:hypothetical protein